MERFLDKIKVNLNEDIERYFENVEIESVKKSKDNSTLNFYLFSHDLIPYKYIKDVECTMAKQLLGLDNEDIENRKNGNPIHIYFKYELSTTYNERLIFEDIKKDLFNELKDTDRILSSIFDISKYEFANDRELKIIFIESEVFKDKQDELVEFIKSVYKYRFGIELGVVKEYIKASENMGIKRSETIKADAEDVTLDSSQETYNRENETNKETIKEDKENVTYVRKNTKGKSKGLGFVEEGDILYGRKTKTKFKDYFLSDLASDTYDVKIKGVIFSSSFKETKNGKVIFNLSVYDGTSSILIKLWGNPDDINMFESRFKIGYEIEISGDYIFDDYEHGFVMRVSMIEKVNERKAITFPHKDPEDDYSVILTDREDNEKEKRVELHLHTKSSVKDGIGPVECYIETALRFGMKAMAITDHGCVNALADAYEYIAKKKIKDFKVINGVEGYLVDDIENFYFDNKNKESVKSYKLNGRYVIYDFITTGVNKNKDYIIKVEAKLIENMMEIDTFSSFIYCDRPLSFEIKNKTGIMDLELKNAPKLGDALTKLLDFGKDAVFVTLNKNSVWKLSEILKEQNINIEIYYIDLIVLSRLIISDLKIDGSTNLTASLLSLAKNLKVKLEGITDRKQEEKKKMLNINERLKLASSIMVAIFKRLSENDSIDDLSVIKSKYNIDDNFISRQKYYHVVLLAKNDVGRVNLYKIVSDSHTKYFHRKPKIPRSLLSNYREGILVGSACILGEFMDAIKKGENNDTLKDIASFYDYLEIQPTMNNSFLLEEESDTFKDIKSLENLNKKVIEIGELLNKPVVATCDCHYIDKEDKIFRTMLVEGSSSKKTDIDENGNIKAEVLAEMESSSKEELFFRTTKEMLDEFSYLGVDKAYEVVVKNTNLISNMIENIVPLRMDKCPPQIEGSVEELTNSCHNNLNKIYGDNPIDPIKERLEKELSYIIDNGYSVMYIAAKKLIDFSKEHGYPVGSRGSVGSSLAATLSGVSEVNPLPPHYICPKCHHIEYNTDETKKYNNDTGFDMPDKICPECGMKMNKDGVNIPFETFLGIPGDAKAQKEPDIDLNFCSVYQSKIHEHTIELFGKENTFKAGTVGTVATKTAYAYVSNYEKRHEISYSKQQKEYCKNKIVECKNTTGQHPGGMVVVPNGEYIYTFTPVQIAADKEGNDTTTHFDYHKIDKNLLKLDLLGHDSPLLLKKLFEYTGVDFNTVPFYETEVLKLFESTESLGITPAEISGTRLGCLTIPEFGTDFAMGMCEDAKPKTVADLIRIAGLAHGTDVWQNNVKDLIENGDCTLSNAICCRDDIMIYLIDKGLDDGLAFNIMESVRKGKGLKTEWMDEMRKHEVPEWYIGCCNKIKYMFPKAHAAAYVLASLRIAYYKVHYPKEYYAAYFSIRKDGFDYKLMIQDKETIHFQIELIKRIINDKKNNRFKTLKETTDSEKSKYEKMSDKNLSDLYMCYRIVEEMKARGVEFCPIDIYTAKASDFQVIGDKIMPSFDSIPGIGTKEIDNDENVDIDLVSTAKKCELEGRNGEYTSISDFRKRTGVNKTIIVEMKDIGIFDGVLDDVSDIEEKDKVALPLMELLK